MNHNTLILRDFYVKTILHLLTQYPVVALMGARQVGKTTLARQVLELLGGNTYFYDLENSAHLARLNDPMLELSSKQGVVMMDEVQHLPALFKTLRVLADRRPLPCRYLVLGSVSPSLFKQTAETLAGRIAYLEIKGFSIQEVGNTHLESLWQRGSFPRSFLAPTDHDSYVWRQNFINTFLERDLPSLGIQIPPITLRRFWIMLAHYSGQTWNASEFARAFGVSDKTVRHYLDILTESYVVLQLAPWWENVSKRQVKSPKIYLGDSGLLHSLLSLHTEEDVLNHPKVGASWEGFIIQTILNILEIPFYEAFFWKIHQGAELDLFFMRDNQRIGIECKRTSSPVLTKNLNMAIEYLKLTHAFIIHAGDDFFELSHKVTALSAYHLHNIKQFMGF